MKKVLLLIAASYLIASISFANEGTIILDLNRKIKGDINKIEAVKSTYNSGLKQITYNLEEIHQKIRTSDEPVKSEYKKSYLKEKAKLLLVYSEYVVNTQKTIGNIINHMKALETAMLNNVKNKYFSKQDLPKARKTLQAMAKTLKHFQGIGLLKSSLSGKKVANRLMQYDKNIKIYLNKGKHKGVHMDNYINALQEAYTDFELLKKQIEQQVYLTKKRINNHNASDVLHILKFGSNGKFNIASIQQRLSKLEDFENDEFDDDLPEPTLNNAKNDEDINFDSIGVF